MYSRNEKYNKIKEKKIDRISMKLDIVLLQVFCNFIVSENKNIHKSNIINMNNLFNNLDMSMYENDTEKLNKINFIKKGIDARLNYNLNKKELILSHISGGILSDDINYIVDEINSDEVIWVNNIVADALNFGYLYSDVNRISDLCDKFKTADYESKPKILKLFKDTVFSLQDKFRQTEANASSDIYFSLDDNKFDECITEVYDKVTSPSNKLITGCVGINELMGGGFEATRVYGLFGLPGEGKSLTMLDFAIQIKKYNPGYICKDPTKKPCVVYLTLENSLEETVVRLCEMVGIEGSMGDYSINELCKKLRTEGELYLNSASPMDLIIIYKPGMSVDTNYLYELVENLEDQGKEPVALILDYIKRIRSATDNSDMRIALGNVINELKVFANLKDLVVITASQLNRDATSHIDESRKANKNDLVRMLGRSQIGESLLILENIDGSFMITPEYDANGVKYLGIQRVKNRYKASNLTYLYYPYQGEIKLLEDYNAIEPVYKTTMKDIPQNYNNLTKINEVKDINEVKLLKSCDNIYDRLAGSISEIDDSEPELKSIVKRITP